MKLITVLSLCSVAAAGATWYDPAADVTCSGDYETGDIRCESGLVGDAPEVDVTGLQSRDAESPEKKPISCTDKLRCSLDCYAKGYCKAMCDAQNNCECGCQNIAWFCYENACLL